ncbi:MAG: hypothetical protein ABIP85_20075 [Chthoniobacteraceae bacterium]
MEERRKNPIEKLTIAGRLLLVFTVLLFATGFCLTFFYIADHFPAGSYPLIVILTPTILLCLFFFIFAAWLLERCGLRIYANRLPK